MSFHLQIAQPDDVPRITQIHMDAFSSNAIIRAIHTYDKGLHDLRQAVAAKALADIGDAKTTVLVARYQDNEIALKGPEQAHGMGRKDSAVVRESIYDAQIIAFAKWAHPVFPDEHVFPTWPLSESKDRRVLDPWLVEVARVEAEIIGESPRYELTYLAVDAAYARRGVGTSMVTWALDRCEGEGYTAYVESTVEALPFYEKLGFKEAGRISMDLGKATSGKHAGFYEEVGCIYIPTKKKSVTANS
ncbi:acyl-CoA N-acyltransferase [Paraphoma chrysanthemicola]|nr:acyl-CoA N-acyltransferase [Paraphoma chrysanthemicola]